MTWPLPKSVAKSRTVGADVKPLSPLECPCCRPLAEAKGSNGSALLTLFHIDAKKMSIAQQWIS